MISTDKLGMIEDFKRPEILMNHNARFDNNGDGTYKIWNAV